jgi:hypothetical protein
MPKFVLPSVKEEKEFVVFTGGLDVVTPPISVPPGNVRRGFNFEEDINGGYQTVTGYERFNGSAAPSTATYVLLPYTVLGSIVVGSSILGNTSAATGTVIAIDTVNKKLVITKTTGVWVSETIVAFAATVVGPAVASGLAGATDSAYKALAANAYRTGIAAVPGIGGVLGVWYYKNVVYAFRNLQAGGVGMYKSTSSGWTLISLGYEVTYSVGIGAQPVEGDTITQGGVTAVVKRITVESGTWAGGNAQGRFIFNTISGGPFAVGATTAGAVCSIGNQTTTTIANQNGRYEFINASFSGSTDKFRMYGCDGKNRAFEFDGTTFVPIKTGMATDTPTHIIEHGHMLFLSFFGSVQNSALGDPLTWTVITGASEIALADAVTGFSEQPGSSTQGALAIFCRNSTYLLYGTSTANFQLIPQNPEQGAIPYTIQNVGRPHVFDDRGITRLETTQNFGNFIGSTISQRVQTWLLGRRGIVTDSHIARDKSQYRIFFSDGSAAYFTINQSAQTPTISMMPIVFPIPVSCSSSQETYGGGSELIYFGSTNGFVYQMERGTSFDGTSISAYLELFFNSQKRYRVLKKFQHLTFELSGSGYCEFQTSYYVNFGDTVNSAQPDVDTWKQTLGNQAYYDEFVWDEFTWDGSNQSYVSASTPADGENIAVRILSNGDGFAPVKFSGVFVEYIPLRAQR